MAHSVEGLMKVDNIDWGREWHMPVYVDGNDPEFLLEVCEPLAAAHGATVTQPAYWNEEHCTVVRITADEQKKVDAVCAGLVEKGAVFKLDCIGFWYLHFSTGDYGDIF